MGNRDLNDLCPQTRAKVDKFLASAKAAGFSILVTDAYRSGEEQDALYAQGRTKPGSVVTNARAGQSFHNVRRAIDVCFLTGGNKVTWSGPWERLGSLYRAAGLTWGGDWQHPDKPHGEDRWCEKHQTDHAKATSFGDDGECELP